MSSGFLGGTDCSSDLTSEKLTDAASASALAFGQVQALKRKYQALQLEADLLEQELEKELVQERRRSRMSSSGKGNRETLKHQQFLSLDMWNQSCVVQVVYAIPLRVCCFVNRRKNVDPAHTPHTRSWTRGSETPLSTPQSRADEFVRPKVFMCLQCMS